MAWMSDGAAAECAAYCMAQIRHIIDSFGQRPPGGAGERACQAHLRGQLEEAGLAPVVESFPVAQKAFMAMPCVAGALALCSVPLYWLAPRLSPLPVTLAVLVFVLELFFYAHILSWFFPKSESCNVFAVVPPHGEKRRRIVVCGHADAAYEWRFNQMFPGRFPLVVAGILLSFLCVTVLCWAAALFGADTGAGGWRWAGLAVLLSVPGLLGAVFFTRFDVASPGAADNLSGALMAVALARWMKQGGTPLENTEYVALVTGCEEAGLEGARAYVKMHKPEWNDVETVAIAVDTLRDLKDMAVYNRDLNGRVRHDPALCALLKDAAKTCGLDLPYATVTIGSSDGTAFTQAGVRAAALCAMDPAPAHYYHNRRDTWENLDENCLVQGARVLGAALEKYDREGLPK